MVMYQKRELKLGCLFDSSTVDIYIIIQIVTNKTILVYKYFNHKCSYNQDYNFLCSLHLLYVKFTIICFKNQEDPLLRKYFFKRCWHCRYLHIQYVQPVAFIKTIYATIF